MPLFLTEVPTEVEITELENLRRHMEEKLMGSFSIDAAAGNNLLPGKRTKMIRPVTPRFRAVMNERRIDLTSHIDAFGDSAEQCNIATDVRLNVLAGNRSTEQ